MLKLDDTYLKTRTGPYVFHKDSRVELLKLRKDMLKTMKRHGGVGLAANQVGLNTSIFLVKDTLMINPSIVEDLSVINSVKTNFYRHTTQGCLSLEGVFATYYPNCLKIQYYNEKGNKIVKVIQDKESEIFYHELNHLNGLTLEETGVKVFTTWEEDSSDDNI